MVAVCRATRSSFRSKWIKSVEKKRSTLLAVMPTTYRVLKNLIAPGKPGDKLYADIVKTLTNHFGPAPSEAVQRFKFNSHSRKPGESVATYVAELRALAEFCNFEDKLENMLRDRLVCGINDTYTEAVTGRIEAHFSAGLGHSRDLEAVDQNVKS